MAIKYLKLTSVRNKTVLLRVDFNEPLTDSDKLADNFRIQAALPTIKFLQQQSCRLILASHLGRPQGKPEKKLSLQPVAKCLAELLELKFVETADRLPDYPAGHLIFFTGDISKKSVREQLKGLKQGDIILLENLRFYPGEDANLATFAKDLASMAEVYVNDAFAVDHRASASTVGVTKFLPSYAGLLLEKEIKNLDYVLRAPKKPFILMMGGVKISDKEETIKNLAKHADKILLGGGLANTLLAAQGMEIGLSVVEKDSERLASQLLRNYKDKIILPKDVVVANKSFDKSSIRHIPVYDVKKNEIMLDIGSKTILEFARILKTAKTLVWNGPLGHFEVRPFHTGTMSLARIVGGIAKGRCFAVVGGGETVDAVRLAHQQDYIDHLSTGGGAMLEYLAGMKLPGLEALKK